MTEAIGMSIFRELAVTAEVPLQECISRNDQSNGSTIGPHVAARTGIRTIDFGGPQLSMHSAREFCGVVDMWYAKKLFYQFLTSFSDMDLTDVYSN